MGPGSETWSSWLGGQGRQAGLLERRRDLEKGRRHEKVHPQDAPEAALS